MWDVNVFESIAKKLIIENASYLLTSAYIKQKDYKLHYKANIISEML